MENKENKSIRILHIVSSMNRQGIENLIMNYYRNMDRDKVQFDFLMSNSDKSDFDDEISELGGRIYRIPLSNPIKCIRDIRRFFKKHTEYKICHVHHIPWGAISLYFARLYGVPHRISHVHFANTPKKHVRIKQFLRKHVLRNSTYYFACSQLAGEKYFNPEILAGQNYKVINNAIDTKKFKYSEAVRRRMRDKLGLRDDDFVLGQVACFSYIKNQKFTLEVLKSLKMHLSSAKVLFLGTGELMEDVKAYARELGVYESCMFLGSVPNPYDYMQCMDALIFPSLSEGLGMVAIEAQASGLHCLVSTGVPAECKLTELVTFLPLAAGAETWANEVSKIVGYGRSGRAEDVIAAGYDIFSNVKKLQDFYIELEK